MVVVVVAFVVLLKAVRFQSSVNGVVVAAPFGCTFSGARRRGGHKGSRRTQCQFGRNNILLMATSSRSIHRLMQGTASRRLSIVDGRRRLVVVGAAVGSQILSQNRGPAASHRRDCAVVVVGADVGKEKAGNFAAFAPTTNKE